MENVQTMQALSFSQIRQQYPDQWMLIGNPELSNPEVNGLIVNKLISGVVLFASKDKREIAYKASGLQKQVESTVCVFTGEIPKKRLFLL